MAKITKQPTISKLKKEADEVFSLYVRYRDSEQTIDDSTAEKFWWAECITCGRRYPLKVVNKKGELVMNTNVQAGHFQSRRFSSTRFNEQNVNLQCRSCNVFNHGEQYKYAKALDLKYGDGVAEELTALAKQEKHFKTWELEDIIRDAQEQVNYYESLS